MNSQNGHQESVQKKGQASYSVTLMGKTCIVLDHGLKQILAASIDMDDLPQEK